ncbi:hypothetical protein VTN77DRAFT_9339 [Rasamsonia byssochlamydoides]|uniref:uncharacterized protein n=1 Tax=Rasamsonia byssochlamydoides TaxID=89139 RepID=UPI003743C6F9
MAGSGHQQDDASSVSGYASLSPGLPPTATTELSDRFRRLSVATVSGSPLPVSSPTFSPAYPDKTPSRAPSRARHVSSSATPGSSRNPAPRRTPSSMSLRDERQLSTPSLRKRLSSSSLRSVSTVHEHTGSAPRPLSRRSSYNHLASPSMWSPKSPLETPLEAPTASSIGAEHFKREMQLHETVDLQSKTLVVIQDACYGHRFSRPRTSKAALSTIVERPERLRASILGLSAAYVRVGKRHAGSAFAPHPDLIVDILPPPPFQIRKTSRSVPLNSPAVTHVHGTKWMDDLKAMCDAAESRLALNGKELVRPRSAGKDDSANAPKFHEGDLYLCSESLSAFEGALGGVCEAVDAVFSSSSTQRAFVCIRPPGHHCSSNHPSGFCWLNNVHIGIAHAAITHGLTHAAIIDFDLHHGDGSQAIAWEQNQRAVSAAKNAAPHKKTAIGYYSLHDINSYPCEMGEEDKVRNASVCIDNAHGQSIWNVHLEPWKTPEEFWQLYNSKYTVLLDKARKFLRFHTDRLRNSPGSPPPKAAIFLSAGFDASEWEGAGMQRHKVNVPTDFYARFTADVVQLAEEEGLGTDGRIISVLEGGYSDRALTSGVLSHLSGLADPRSSVQEEDQQSRLASEMIGRLGWNNDVDDRVNLGQENARTVVFDTEWWAPELLQELETLAYPPPTPPKKPQKTGPTFFAPTQSSAAKVVAPAKERKSSPAGMDDIPPPLPDVDWATAAHELFKVLIPSDRQTTSCRPEDLNAEASRVRRERAMTADQSRTHAATDEKRMQLRERKPKSSLPGTRPTSRSSRRTTIASVSDLPDQTLRATSRDSSRRRQSSVSPVISDGDTHAERAPTRATSRPATAAGHHSSGAMVVKKSRAPSSSRSSEPKRSSSPKKAPPVPKVPSSHLNTIPASSTGLQNEGSTQPTQTGPTSENGDRRDQDIDSLTAGVRKLTIKLKVPSPEENAIREKKAAEERKKAEESKKHANKKPVGTKPTKTTVQKPAAKVSRAAPSPEQSSQSNLANGGIRVEVPAIKAEISPLSSPHVDGAGPVSPSISVTSDGISGVTSASNGFAVQQSGPALSPPLTPEFPQKTINPQITVQPPTASAAPASHQQGQRVTVPENNVSTAPQQKPEEE